MAKFNSSKVASPANTAGILASLRDVRVSAAMAEIERLEALKTGAKAPAQDPAWAAGLAQDAIEDILSWEKALRRMVQSLSDRLTGEETRRQAEREEISAIQAEVDRALVVGVRPDEPAVRAAQARMKDLRAGKFARARKMFTDGKAISEHISTGRAAGHTRCLAEETISELKKLVDKSEKVFLGLQKPKKTKKVQTPNDRLVAGEGLPSWLGIDETDPRLYSDTGKSLGWEYSEEADEASIVLKAEEREPAMALALRKVGLG